MSRLQQSTDKIIEESPKQTDVIIAAMNDMPSVDAQQNDPQRVFVYLNSAMEYTVNFFKNPDSDPRIFAPPSPPNSIKLSKDDLNNFTARATNFISDNWSAIQSHAYLTGDGKAKVANQAEMDFMRHKVGREQILRSELGRSKGPVKQNGSKSIPIGIGGTANYTEDQKKFGLQTAKGAALGFLTGGKAGAVKGAITSGGKEMQKQVQEKRNSRGPESSQEAGVAPKMR